MLAWQSLKELRQTETNQHRHSSSQADNHSRHLPPHLLAPQLLPALEALGPSLDAADPAQLAQALTDEGQRRLDTFLNGTLAYRRQAPSTQRRDQPALWSAGTTRLLDYRVPLADAATAPRILVIPSLINRYYILDLEPEASFLRYLAQSGLQPFAIDWDAPGDLERSFSLSDYIADRLVQAYRALQAQPGGPIILVGYCMGGLLALALAQLLQKAPTASDLAGLVLLATPWDFHAEQGGQAAMVAAMGQQMEPAMAMLGELPVDLLQGFFSLLDPFQVLRKFQSFAALDATVPAPALHIRRFTQLEDWLNDGVALSADVARECLQGWYGNNTTAMGKWRVGGNIIDPRSVKVPSLAFIPAQDRIVPPGSALALARALPLHDIVTPAAGHIGMMAGSKAKSQVWPSIVTWLKQRATAMQADNAAAR
jgi:polyhydroxyalkanoate synthase